MEHLHRAEPGGHAASEAVVVEVGDGEVIEAAERGDLAGEGVVAEAEKLEALQPAEGGRNVARDCSDGAILGRPGPRTSTRAVLRAADMVMPGVRAGLPRGVRIRRR